MVRKIIISIALISTATFALAQNGIENCFNGTLSLEDPQCAFLNEPIKPECGPIRYYLPTIWRVFGLDMPTSLFIYTAFDEVNVRIFSSDGLTGAPTFEDSLIVKNTAPVDYLLVDEDIEVFRVSSMNYNQVEDGKGLILESDFPLTIIYRLINVANQSFFVLKGSDGLGYQFGATSQTDVVVPATPFEAHFVSVMAMEDNTTVRFQKNGYFIEGPMNNPSPTGDIDISDGREVTLDAGQTYMIRDNVSSSTSVSGIMVTCNKPVTAVSGSGHSRHGSGVNDRDAGMDQLIPLNKAGKEYVAVRGTNVENIDYLILTALQDGTDVSINGSSIGTMTTGEIMEYKLDGTGGEIFHIESNNNFCAFHISGLFDEEVGMAQLPAMELCSGNSRVDFALVGLDKHIYNIIIPNAGLPTLTINGAHYSTITSERPVPTTDMSVVSFEKDDLPFNGNVILSDELFHVGVITGSDAGGSYGYITKYGNELVLFDASTDIPLNTPSFTAFINISTASSTGFTQEIGVISCGSSASIVSVNGNTSSFVTENGSAVSFSDLSIDYRSAPEFLGSEELEVIIEDDTGQSGAICITIEVVIDEICDNGIDDDMDGEIDEIEECPIDTVLIEICDNGIDDDLDGEIDEIDECPIDTVLIEICDNKIDDDLDGEIDEIEDCPVEICDPLCLPEGNSDNQWIDKISMNQVTITTGRNDGYGDFRNLRMKFGQGDSLSLWVFPGYLENVCELSIHIYADWNRDCDFDDEGELLFWKRTLNETGTNIAIPYVAVGEVTIRFIVNYGRIRSACQECIDGEIEDYTLKIFGRNDNSNPVKQETASLAKSSFGLFPNATIEKNSFIIENALNSSGPVKINIYSLDGNIITGIELEKGQKEFSSDFLQAGVYIFELKTDKVEVCEKLIVRK